MQCPNCKFENIPGQVKCFQCGCILEAKEPIDTNPPRMKHWQKPFRAFQRSMRSIGIQNVEIPQWLDFISCQSIFAIFLSLIPGLGHLIQRRFSEIKWIILIWAVLIAGGLFFLGRAMGFFLLSSAIGVHGYIIVDAMLFENTFYKIFVMNILMSIFVFYLYCVIIWHTIFGIFGCYSGVDIPAMQIHLRDYFLAQQMSHVSSHIDRGDFYVAPTSSVTNHGRTRSGSSIVCQIIGLPGETVEIKDDTFFINGTALDKDVYPVQKWLEGRILKTTLGNEQYFVNIMYNANRRAQPNMIIAACTVSKNDFTGKALAKWQPWLERRIFRE